MANPRQLPLIPRSQRKNDRNDAETLARLGRLDEALLSPIEHRGEEAQEHLALIQARAQLVATRAALINHVRGTVKAHGERLPSSSAPAFARKMVRLIPEGLQPALLPLLTLIEEQTRTDPPVRPGDRAAGKGGLPGERALTAGAGGGRADVGQRHAAGGPLPSSLFSRHTVEHPCY